MTTTTLPPVPHGLPPILWCALIDICDFLGSQNDTHAATFDLLLIISDRNRSALAGALYALSLRPGCGDSYTRLVDDVSTAAHDVETGYRAPHEGTCGVTYGTGCGDCDDYWQQLLNDAVDELVRALGDRACADLRGLVTA